MGPGLALRTPRDDGGECGTQNPILTTNMKWMGARGVLHYYPRDFTEECRELNI